MTIGVFMEALREILIPDSRTLSIMLPASYIKQKVEVLVFPLSATDIELAQGSRRPSVGKITSKEVMCQNDAFAPLNEDELKDWALM
jgi:hypothetical protein